MLMLCTHAVKIEGVRKCMAGGSINTKNYISSSKTAVMLHQQATYTLLLGREIVRPKPLELCMLLSIGHIQNVEHVSHHSSHVCCSDKHNICMLWECNHGLIERQTKSERFHNLPLLQQKFSFDHVPINMT